MLIPGQEKGDLVPVHVSSEGGGRYCSCICLGDLILPLIAAILCESISASIKWTEIESKRLVRRSYSRAWRFRD